MEHINQGMKRLTSALAAGSGSGPTSTASPSTQRSPDVLERAANVWASLRALYGGRFAQTYGAEPNELWLDAIAELTDAECARGFAALRKSQEDWPPSLPKFVGFCRPRDAGVRFLGVPETQEQRNKRLAVLPASPETRDRHLASMRKTMGMTPKDPPT